MVVSMTPEVKQVLETLLIGLDIEKKHRFINTKGRLKYFDVFVRQSLKQILNYVIDDSALPDLLLRFQRYGMMDMPARMAAVDALEQFCRTLLNPPKPKKVVIPDEDLPPPQRRVGVVKGVGPRMEKLLNGVGVQTVEDLVRYAPRQYIDYKERQSLSDVMEGEYVSVIATVKRVDAHPLRNGKLFAFRMMLVDDAGGKASTQRFFSTKQRALMEAMKTRYPTGTEILISGKVKWDSFNHCPAIDGADIQTLSYEDNESAESKDLMKASSILPVYPLTQGLNLKSLRRCIQHGLDDFADQLPDVLPRDIRVGATLIPMLDALQNLHFPDTLDQADQAKRRFGFEELFLLQMRLGLMRQAYKSTVQGQTIHKLAGGLVDQYIASLPYSLTGAQARSFVEICGDLESPLPMNRLLHGDVGSGKTLVAIITLLVGIENGYQGALMAPTEILAEQHYQGLVEALSPMGIKVSLLVGKMGAKNKRATLTSLENGQIHLAVGTHALIQESVNFHRLGVVVVDEQHRFGVKQRLALRSKGADDHMPELLSMTATPIPRTMAMTLHGDLDVSVLDELPPGRSPIITRMMKNGQREEAYNQIETQIAFGRQAYIVYPLIDESESLAAKAATKEFETLRTEIFPHRKVGLMHGKLKSIEKEATMAAFASGELDILVSTTVVEVGVNVPNASIMLIESAERFGLAQLHQLRGRVGRAEHQSYCILISQLKNEDTRKRLEIMEATSDGFVIAEHDLAIRGPGDYVGLRQSGLPELQFANLVDDYELLAQARAAAFTFLEAHTVEEMKADYASLWDVLQRSGSEEMKLLSSG